MLVPDLELLFWMKGAVSLGGEDAATHQGSPTGTGYGKARPGLPVSPGFLRSLSHQLWSWGHHMFTCAFKKIPTAQVLIRVGLSSADCPGRARGPADDSVARGCACSHASPPCLERNRIFIRWPGKGGDCAGWGLGKVMQRGLIFVMLTPLSSAGAHEPPDSKVLVMSGGQKCF